MACCGVLGKELYNARKKAALSQEVVAARAGISREYLSQLENDKKSPTVRVFLNLCRALGVSASRLIEKLDKAG
ncbi:helix-turn-helix transcriptional regulator [Humisphaera borealis]|uniref:Helix-turn-helix transcriptional regulator n=1 Tax=Humisphaera borealis TaxID=2807512 RepID=A0A7M2X4M4_9BACT|nr:helix-turn-helix transcriptional regulator [Humisphaera borealis]